MSPDQQIERSMLDGKDREQLHTIAGAVGVKGATRMRKADLIEAILATANAGAEHPSPESAESTNGGDDAAKPRRVRSVRSSELVDDSLAALAEEENSLGGDADDVDALPAPRPVRARASASSAPVAESPASDLRSTGRRCRRGSRRARPRRPGRTARRVRQPETTRRSPTRMTTTTTGSRSATATAAGGAAGAAVAVRTRSAPGGGEPREREFQGEPIPVQGLLDLRDEGYGFLRASGYLPGPKDVYISASQVRRFALRKGDYVQGTSRPQASNEKYPALLRVDDINGMSPDAARERAKFEDLTPLFPDSRLRLELPDEPHEITGRIVDLISPIGKGQRGLIVSPPKAGKTTILKQLVYAIERNNPEVHLMVLLVDERPEEVTDMRRHVLRGEVVASTFDRPSDEHTHVAELTIERAKRLVEMGTDVVIVLDGITRLARAYNLAAPTSGRIMSGGVDSTALYPPKRFFGAARNIEEGGSLTIVATALIETGSRMDEVIFEEFKGTGNMELRLDRRLAERRIYPSIDVEASSTRHEELLFDRQQLQQVWKLRRVLNALEEGKGLELLIDKIRTTKSNDEFLAEIAKAPSPGS